MTEQRSDKIKIGISSCLLGENVRYDAGHKKNAYITEVLADYFDFVSFCPEVNIGLGVPREPIRLVVIDDDIHCVGTKTAGMDVTERLRAAADEQNNWHRELCGYLLKSRSPSCGMENVELYRAEVSGSDGVGVYARRLMDNLPYLPVEEEQRLDDPQLRNNFIQRVYIYSRWKSVQQGLTLDGLKRFHARYEYTFISHDPVKATELGALLDERSDRDIRELAAEYLAAMTDLLKILPTRNNRVIALQQLQEW